MINTETQRQGRPGIGGKGMGTTYLLPPPPNPIAPAALLLFFAPKGGCRVQAETEHQRFQLSRGGRHQQRLNKSATLSIVCIISYHTNTKACFVYIYLDSSVGQNMSK